MYMCMHVCMIELGHCGSISGAEREGFGNRPSSRRGETAAGGPRDRRTPGGSFLIGAISQKVFGILI